MSLKDTLNDLKDGIENISTESLESISVKTTSDVISIERFSKESLIDINNKFNLSVIRNNIKPMVRVDHSVALEVFTMLPDISISEQAKLTSNPSINNKEILEKVFNTNLDNKWSPDVSEKLYDLKGLIETHLDKFEEVYKYFKILKELIEPKLTVLRTIPPLIVEAKYYQNEEERTNKNVNLLTDKVYDILQLDDSKLEYDKYNGTLINQYSDFYYDQTLKELSTVEHYLILSELTLNSFIGGITSINESLERKEKDLKDYVSGLNSIQKGEIDLNSDVIEYVNGHDSVAFNLEYLCKVYETTKVENNCFDKVVMLIAFLDYQSSEKVTPSLMTTY